MRLATANQSIGTTMMDMSEGQSQLDEGTLFAMISAVNGEKNNKGRGGKKK